MSRRPKRGQTPCAVHPRTGGGNLVHPDGPCACFHGGPAPVHVLDPEIAVLADRPGVFDTSWIGQTADGPPAQRGPVRALLRRLRRRDGDQSAARSGRA
jgi:hypothetical protein